MTSQMASEQLTEEWKKKDPFLMDMEGFERFVEAQELKRLIRLGHPKEGYTRFEVMDLITKRGMQILDDLGWPSNLESKYANRYTGDISTLKELVRDSVTTPLAKEMHQLEETMNDLTRGEYYGDFAGVGIETCNVSTIRKLLKNHESPELKQTIHRCVLLHKAFYERYGHYDNPKLLTHPFHDTSTCIQNLIKLCRWLKISIDELTPETELPAKTYDHGVWSVLEHWEPNKEPKRISA